MLDLLADVALGVLVLAVILWVFGYMVITFKFGEPYIGGGPSYRNWTSGATQRYATEFSGTNQGYPGNMATNVHLPTAPF